LIDLAFNSQSGTLRRALSFLDGTDRSIAGMNDPALRKVEQHLQQFGEAYARSFIAAVPGPSTITIAGLVTSLAGLVRRKRRRQRSSSPQSHISRRRTNA